MSKINILLCISAGLLSPYVFSCSTTPTENHTMLPVHESRIFPQDYSNTNKFQIENNKAMADMHHAMSEVTFTGNNDTDFMSMMIPHHEGAIKMAEIILETSTDTEVVNLARGIITEQQNEINIMQHLIEERKK